MLVHERVRDDRGRIVLRQKHQTLAQLLDAGLVTPEQRQDLLVVVGVRDPYDLVLTEYARNREAGAIPAHQRLLRRLGLLGGEYSAADFERFVRRRYAPGRLLRLLGRRPFVPVDWTAGTDHVIRFERMQADLDEALRRVGVTEQLVDPAPQPDRVAAGCPLLRAVYARGAGDRRTRLPARARAVRVRLRRGRDRRPVIYSAAKRYGRLTTWVTPTFSCERRERDGTGKEAPG